jgi:hypothetical protein
MGLCRDSKTDLVDGMLAHLMTTKDIKLASITAKELTTCRGQ